MVDLCLWSAIEVDVGVICPCLPSLRLLLRRLIPRVMGTVQTYELDHVNTGGAIDNLTSTNNSVNNNHSRASGRKSAAVIKETQVTEKSSNDGGSNDGQSFASRTMLVPPENPRRYARESIIRSRHSIMFLKDLYRGFNSSANRSFFGFSSIWADARPHSAVCLPILCMHANITEH